MESVTVRGIIPASLNRPLLDPVVYQGHEALGFFEGDDGLLIVLDVVP